MESSNLSTPEEFKTDELAKYGEPEEISMSKEEMQQIIESQKRELKYLQQKIERMKSEKEQIIDNFKISSSVLLERIKDLEANQTIGHERPQTACVLNNIQSGRIGEPFYNKKMGEEAQVLEISPVKQEPAEKKVLGREKSFKVEEDEAIQCPNCNEIVPGDQAAAHTIQCYRNSTKCRICGEVIMKKRKQEHLAKWRDLNALQEAIKMDNEDKASLFFDHGCDVNLEWKELGLKTPMHLAGEAGALQVLLALISRGAGVDPTDEHLRTPLTLAIENNKFACARSLIELGADIEQRDKYDRTPVLFGCMLGSKPTVELLIQNGADLKVTNKLGEGCMSLAQRSRNQDLIMLLVKHGASLRPASSSLRPLSGRKINK